MPVARLAVALACAPVVLAGAVVAPASAAAPAAGGAGARPAPAGTVPPDVLPAQGARAARVEPGTWLVGARPGRRAAVVARRVGGVELTGRGVYRVARPRARALARGFADAGVYRFAEPDGVLGRSQAPLGGDDFAATDWRPAIRPPATVPPVAGAPLTAVIDDAADPTHPDLAGLRSGGLRAIAEWHGTAVASLVGGRANRFGMVGVYPGAPLLSLGTTFSYGDVARQIASAVEAGAKVINLSLGGDYSYAIHLELAYAVSQGVLPVAAAGNDRHSVLPDGTANPVNYPAALPHVLSVASMGPSGASSDFSTSNGAVDVAAPGESVLAAVPSDRDPDGTPDGFARVDGTSFASPIVAGAAAWLLAARPALRPGQVAGLLRSGARDLRPRGWDPDSGYGVIDLGASLAEPAPPDDPFEVNDDIPWVDGTRFTRADRPVNGRAKRVRVRAEVDQWKDPADVYRVRVPARRRLRISVRPARYADPDLELYGRAARTIYRTRGRLAGSYRGAGRRDRVTLRAGRRSRLAYVVVFHPGASARYLDAPYRLTVERRR